MSNMSQKPNLLDSENMKISEPNELDIRCIINLLKEKMNMDANTYREKFLKRRIKLKMKEKGFSDCSKFYVFLKRNIEELEELFYFITINYTCFYRDKSVYDYFYNRLIPKIFNKNNIIRILSAGCSTGEEPYTLAIILKNYCEKYDYRKKISIYALDIDNKVLNRAKEGIYGLESLKNMDVCFIEKYFTKNDDSYIINDCIKDNVKFKRFDITKELVYKHYDVIFCRNVFIYFNNDAKRKILLNFHDALNKDGYLIIGKTEMMPSSLNSLYKSISGKQKIYAKI